MVTSFDERWVIDLDWLEANHRSFGTLVKGSLCPKCRKKFGADLEDAPSANLLKALKNCCSGESDFITATMPLQESAFRVLLANGNKSLSLDELEQQVNDRRGIDAYRVSVPLLARLLKNDQHYGLRPVQI